MADYHSLFLYFGLVGAVTAMVLALSALFAPKKISKTKYLPYESGIITETRLLQERFTLHHYLVALMFLLFDIEVIFLYPWAVIAKKMGPFAFYEMTFFLAALTVGFIYAWRKGGLQWE